MAAEEALMTPEEESLALAGGEMEPAQPRRGVGHQPDRTQLWKEWDKKAEKSGPHHTVYWVRRNHKLLERQKNGLGGEASNPGGESEYVTGERYTGDWEGNMKHGFGTYAWMAGHKYEGEWCRDQRHGKGTFWVRNGPKLRKQYTGDWRNNTRHGLGIFYYASGDKYEGEWRSNARHGRGKMVYANGEVFEGDWVEDKRSGLGSLTKANGDRYEGHWVNDKKEGPGRFYYASTRKVYEGEWVDDHAKCGVFRDTPAEQFEFDFHAPVDGFDLPALALVDPEMVVSDAIAQVRQDRAVRRAAEAGEEDSAAVFNATEMTQLRAEFQLADPDNSGVIRCGDLLSVLQGLGMSPLQAEIDALLAELNADAATEITFAEFVDVMALFYAE